MTRVKTYKFELGRTTIGAIVIFLGLGFLLDSVFDVSFNLWQFWPVGLIIFGWIKLVGANSRGDRIWGAIVLVAGAFLLLDNLFGWDGFSLFDIFRLWPLLLIVIGLRILFKSNRRSRTDAATAADFLNIFVVFGGSEKRVTTRNFLGGDITCLFGGVDLDLRDAEIQEETAELELFVVFGGADIQVPDGWKLVDRVTPVFGSFEDSRRPLGETTGGTFAGPQRTLVVKGMALFGGVELKS